MGCNNKLSHDISLEQLLLGTTPVKQKVMQSKNRKSAASIIADSDFRLILAAKWMLNQSNHEQKCLLS